jgi:protein-tyrosine-phosphatase
MAEAYLKKLGGAVFEVESCGIAAGSINPLVVEVMEEK